MKSMDVRRWLTTIAAVALPIVVAVAALPLRTAIPSADVAAALVGVAALAGTLGVAFTPVLVGVSAALSFVVLWAEPYGSLEVQQPGDRLSGGVVLVVGAALAMFCRRRRRLARPALPRLRRRRESANDHLRTVGRVAGEIADGDMAGLVVLDVARSLVEVLGLRACKFGIPPFAAGSKPLLDRNGEMELWGVRWDPTSVGLPAGGFYVPVIARGRTGGRYLCMPRLARRRIETMSEDAHQDAARPHLVTMRSVPARRTLAPSSTAIPTASCPVILDEVRVVVERLRVGGTGAVVAHSRWRSPFAGSEATSRAISLLVACRDARSATVA